MKLAEALQIRSDLQRRLSELEYRLRTNATVQEGENPPEDPAELIKEYEECSKELEGYIIRINNTNANTQVDGTSLTALLAKRECLKMKINCYDSFIGSASNLSNRAKQTEIKVMSTIDVRDFRKNLDALSKELRDLDIKIQSQNWTVDLK